MQPITYHTSPSYIIYDVSCITYHTSPINLLFIILYIILSLHIVGIRSPGLALPPPGDVPLPAEGLRGPVEQPHCLLLQPGDSVADTVVEAETGCFQQPEHGHLAHGVAFEPIHSCRQHLVDDCPLRSPNDGKWHHGLHRPAPSGGQFHTRDVDPACVGARPPLEEQHSVGVLRVHAEAECGPIQIRVRLVQLEGSVGSH
mmetsp:Transcript_30208/g.66861  ORF Transcript_30208/g.66861 Transcript_30208/m.66861 type:complete len:200 (+) Transcript_30208:28-627(+)